jgi:hypothetical protein
MTESVEPALHPFLRWDPSIIYDPVPEWWLRGVEKSVAAEILATRLDALQQVLRIQADSLAKAAELVRRG